MKKFVFGFIVALAFHMFFSSAVCAAEIDDIYSAQSGLNIHGVTTDGYVYDRALPFNEIVNSECANAESLRSAMTKHSELFVPTIDADGNFMGYTIIDTSNNNEIIAYYEGGFYDFIYNSMEKAAVSEIGSDFDEVYFTSDSMFNDVGLIFVKNGEEYYFDISGYYNAKYNKGSIVSSDYSEFKTDKLVSDKNNAVFTYSGKSFLEIKRESYMAFTLENGEGGIINSTETEDEVIDEKIEIISETEDTHTKNPLTGGNSAVSCTALLMLSAGMLAVITKK